MSDRQAAAGELTEHPLTPRGVLATAHENEALIPTAMGLIFLLFIIGPAWQDYSAGRAIAVTAVALIFGLMYVGSVGIRSYSARVRGWWLALTWVVLAALALLIGTDIVYMVMYVVVVHAVLLSWQTGRIAVVAIGLAGLAASVVLGETFALFLSVAGTIFALGLGFSIQKEILEQRAERAEQRSAVLAVAAERERIGRDLHDILGHSLTTITVSAQLARRLVDADPQAARAQIAEIERISRQSLADVRATASGMQQVRAASEIASARTVLAAAGIDAVAPVALPSLPDDHAELLGYVIREAVTNVVRHSRASRCTIALDGTSATVSDDGVGLPAGRARTGLEGLRRRVEEAGGRLVVERGERGGTVLRAELPERAEEAVA